ncbi:hypothetical protein BD779DRAFT_1560087 [Infundibulicybe gibba]|nr:hypothetical protein BD779DRAFT_1560087 [Infundibulicybe gibba]
MYAYTLHTYNNRRNKNDSSATGTTAGVFDATGPRGRYRDGSTHGTSLGRCLFSFLLLLLLCCAFFRARFLCNGLRNSGGECSRFLAFNLGRWLLRCRPRGRLGRRSTGGGLTRLGRRLGCWLGHRIRFGGCSLGRWLSRSGFGCWLGRSGGGGLGGRFGSRLGRWFGCGSGFRLFRGRFALFRLLRAVHFFRLLALRPPRRFGLLCLPIPLHGRDLCLFLLLVGLLHSGLWSLPHSRFGLWDILDARGATGLGRGVCVLGGGFTRHVGG